MLDLFLCWFYINHKIRAVRDSQRCVSLFYRYEWEKVKVIAQLITEIYILPMDFVTRFNVHKDDTE